MARLVIQGLTEANHLDALAHVLSLEGSTSTIMSIAFIRASGVTLLSSMVKPIANHIRVFAGIRNGVTSAQGIKALVDAGVELYTVDTGSLQKIYHPKLYYSRSATRARLLVGSANLTAGGLDSNVEASVLLELDLDKSEDLSLCESFEATFDQLVANYPSNVTKIGSDTELADLLADARYEDESFATAPVVKHREGTIAPAIPHMRLHRMHKLAPRNTRAHPNNPEAIERAGSLKKPALPTAAAAPKYVRAWRTADLTMRDLGVSPKPETHAPGSMNLDKGDLKGPYEWATYFRDHVFNDLIWSAPSSANIIQANASFRIVIGGVDHGEFNLTVRHDNKVGTPSYRQQNAMTRLSWNGAKQVISRPELVGRSLTLSKDVTATGKFLIEID